MKGLKSRKIKAKLRNSMNNSRKPIKTTNLDKVAVVTSMINLNKVEIVNSDKVTSITRSDKVKVTTVYLSNRGRKKTGQGSIIQIGGAKVQDSKQAQQRSVIQIGWQRYRMAGRLGVRVGSKGHRQEN